MKEWDEGVMGGRDEGGRDAGRQGCREVGMRGCRDAACPILRTHRCPPSSLASLAAPSQSQHEWARKGGRRSSPQQV